MKTKPFQYVARNASAVSGGACKMSRISLAVVALAATGLLPQQVAAAEHNLDFKLVVMPLEVNSFDIPNVEGQKVSLLKMTGVAYFTDGRVASKNFVISRDYNNGSGPFFGYSTYEFEDGSSITARFAGTLRAGQPIHGEYTVLSGTGDYSGATGTGTFDGVPHKLTGASLLNGKFSITTP